jgi:hypothetical protein
MRIGEPKGTSSRQFGLAGRGVDSAEPAAESRALVALAPAAAAHATPENYRQAPFLAHLIAMKEQLPQTRERRRAEPQEALAAYRATVDLMMRR